MARKASSAPMTGSAEAPVVSSVSDCGLRPFVVTLFGEEEKEGAIFSSAVDDVQLLLKGEFLDGGER